MPITSYIFIRFLSFLCSILCFWWIETGLKQRKINTVRMFFSLLMTFYLTFFFSKFLFKLPTLLHSPMTVIAYPSGTLEFYLGIIAMAGHYLWTNHTSNGGAELNWSIIRLFSAALFSYYFLVYLMNEHSYGDQLTFWYLIYFSSIVNNGTSRLTLLAAFAYSLGLSMTERFSDIMRIPIHPVFYIIITLFMLILVLSHGKGALWKQKLHS
ncbi:hypothetical protein [Thalassobacillus sp. CUG 92003]|uniref:hypothetical protein n=1 Tax=Thalassobacillus sp. CUG 92003 TaxID=2736641 RepID=UPI0015E7E381|nr:hypothetical protein [Thalassobacillus sp. CUG 92003]